MAAMTWEGMFRGTSLLCSTPKENRFGRRLFRVDSFTWDVRGPLPSEGRAWARLGYFSRPTGDLAGRAKSLIEALG